MPGHALVDTHMYALMHSKNHFQQQTHLALRDLVAQSSRKLTVAEYDRHVSSKHGWAPMFSDSSCALPLSAASSSSSAHFNICMFEFLEYLVLHPKYPVDSYTGQVQSAAAAQLSIATVSAAQPPTEVPPAGPPIVLSVAPSVDVAVAESSNCCDSSVSVPTQVVSLVSTASENSSEIGARSATEPQIVREGAVSDTTYQSPKTLPVADFAFAVAAEVQVANTTEEVREDLQTISNSDGDNINRSLSTNTAVTVSEQPSGQHVDPTGAAADTTSPVPNKVLFALCGLYEPPEQTGLSSERRHLLQSCEVEAEVVQHAEHSVTLSIPHFDTFLQLTTQQFTQYCSPHTTAVRKSKDRLSALRLHLLSVCSVEILHQNYCNIAILVKGSPRRIMMSGPGNLVGSLLFVGDSARFQLSGLFSNDTFALLKPSKQQSSVQCRVLRIQSDAVTVLVNWVFKCVTLSHQQCAAHINVTGSNLIEDGTLAYCKAAAPNSPENRVFVKVSKYFARSDRTRDLEDYNQEIKNLLLLGEHSKKS